MSSEINATDSAVELADELGIDINDVTGTGADGRILKKDVQASYIDLVAANTVSLVGILSPTEEAEKALAEIGVRVQTSVVPPSTPVWVKLVGSSRAMLGGTYLLRNETRRVPFHTYNQAKNGRPGDFAVKFDGSNEYMVEVDIIHTSDEEE